jgi:regulatory protein
VVSGSEEKLAPVTYLFGAKAQVESETGVTMPETALPGAVLPETVLPETVLPKTVLPETVLPETVLPETVLPKTVLRESEPLAGKDATSQLSGGLSAGLSGGLSGGHSGGHSGGLSGEGSGKFERVNNVSLNALARKGMSSVEMTQLLESRDIDPDAVAAEIDRLEGVGLLDDLALAETLVRTLQERKGLGRSAINAELRRRKIDVEAINEAMEAVDGDDELTRAIEIAQKRASQLSSYDTETAKRRLSAYLMRRGYNGSIISAAIAASLGSTSSGSRTSLSHNLGNTPSHSTPRFR